MLIRTLLLAGLSLVLVLAGCLSGDDPSATLSDTTGRQSGDDPGDGTIDPEKELNENRELWLSKKPDRYEFRFLQYCECPHAYQLLVVTVERDDIVSVVHEESSNPVIEREGFFTIDGLFELLQRFVRTADTFEVEYNADLGYPEKVFVDASDDAIDDEVRYFLDRFSAK